MKKQVDSNLILLKIELFLTSKNIKLKLNISKRAESDKESMEKLEDGVSLIAGLNLDEEASGFQSNTFKN